MYIKSGKHNGCTFSFNALRTPDVYTQFRKRVESQAPVRKCLDMPKSFRPLPEGVEEGEIPTNKDLGVEGKQYFIFIVLCTLYLGSPSCTVYCNHMYK